MSRKTLLVAAVFSLTAFGTWLLAGSSASALSGRDFRADRIIDDALFYNGNAMSVEQIQAFLNARVPVCDTMGTQGPFFDRNGRRWNTRADFGRAHGIPPPYICLRDFRQDHGARSDSGLCSPIAARTNQSAAQIIDTVARACNISQKVLIVKLQKEQGLITDTWPWPSQYDRAMGFFCPDDPNRPGWCHPDFAGFFTQVYSAARQFNRYRLFPNNFNHAVGRTSWVAFQANAPHCGGTNLTMQNAATAGLYNYTPYQPNAAALNNLYGGGDDCSAYGNRNFWRLYNDWFGSTRVVHLEGCHEATNTARSCIWRLASPTGEPFFTSSVSTRDHLVNARNYQFQGRQFFGNVIQLPGNIPVYRLDRPNGGSFITSNKIEYSTLVRAGWISRGIDFWTDPGHSNTGYPVYRLFNPSKGHHIWTKFTSEVASLQAGGYRLESIPFVSISTVRQEIAPPVGMQLSYRLYIPQTNNHIWTNHVHERDSLILAGHRYEGVAWRTLSDTSQRAVHRLYAPSLQKHLFTASENERNALVASGGYRYEGIAFYVSRVPTARPVFRVFAPSLGKHLLTMDANERNTLVASGRWNDEGIAWFIP